MGDMVDRREWAEFKRHGLLWLANRTLHLFGWAIVFTVEANGAITEVYPARVKWRGFDDESETWPALAKWNRENAQALEDECNLP